MGAIKSTDRIILEIVVKPVGQRGFSVLPRCWVVEHTFAWLMRWRRLVRYYERLRETHEAMGDGRSHAQRRHGRVPSRGE